MALLRLRTLGIGVYALSFTAKFLTVLAQADSGFDYNGGVSLFWPNSSCPAGTIAGDIESVQLVKTCCGLGQVYDANSTYCCPSSMPGFSDSRVMRPADDSCRRYRVRR